MTPKESNFIFINFVNNKKSRSEASKYFEISDKKINYYITTNYIKLY